MATSRPYKLSGGSMRVRVSDIERRQLDEYATAESLPLGQAVRRLMRIGLAAPRQDPEAKPETSPAGRHDMLLEVGLLNLVAAEQVLQLLETITPEGTGAGEAFLSSATQAAHSRIVRGAESASFGGGDGRD
jgi:hypothetical protein